MLKRQRGEVGVKSENANAKKRKTKATAEDLPPELTEVSSFVLSVLFSCMFLPFAS